MHILNVDFTDSLTFGVTKKKQNFIVIFNDISKIKINVPITKGGEGAGWYGKFHSSGTINFVRLPLVTEGIPRTS